MDCQFKMHKSMAVAGFCINSACDQIEFYCNDCLNEFHYDHQQDCIKFEDSENLIEKLKENQRSLYESLKNMNNKYNMRSHIEKLESNLQKIDQLKMYLPSQCFSLRFQSLEDQNNQLKLETTMLDEENYKFSQKFQEYLSNQLESTQSQKSVFIQISAYFCKDLKSSFVQQVQSIQCVIVKGEVLKQLNLEKEADEIIEKAQVIDSSVPNLQIIGLLQIDSDKLDNTYHLSDK